MFVFFFLPVSPPKDYGVRASEQLNTLRTLLETRLHEQDDLNYPIKDSSILQTSPGTFTKDFLQSYKYKNHSKEYLSDLDDDDDDDINDDQKRFHRNRDKYQSDALSTSTTSTNQNESIMTDDINQDRIHLSTSNYTPKIDRRKKIEEKEEREDLTLIFLDESRTLTNSSNNNGIYSHKPSISNSDAIETTSDSEHISEANFDLQNRYISTSSKESSLTTSQSNTPIVHSALNTYDPLHDHLIDSSKGSSLLTGTSFDVLMNSLKTMRERDLDYLIHNSDDSLIRVTD